MKDWFEKWRDALTHIFPLKSDKGNKNAKRKPKNSDDATKNSTLVNP